MTPNQRQRTRRQHFLPQNSHLKHFTKDGKLAVMIFNHPDDRMDIVRRAKLLTNIDPNSIGHVRDLYESPALPDNTLEDYFAGVEARYATIFEQKILKHIKLTASERYVVSLYISILENRTPAQRDNLTDFVNRIEASGNALNDAHDASDEAREHWSSQMQEMKDTMFAQWLVTNVETNKWRVLDLCFIEIPEHVDLNYITSDSPVTLRDYARDNSPYGLNQWSKTAECVVALSSKVAVFGNNVGVTGYRDADYNIVREINKRTMAQSRDMVISDTTIDANENKAIVQHVPQSLIVMFARLPDGNREKILKRQKRREFRQKIYTRIKKPFRRKTAEINDPDRPNPVDF